MFSHLHREGLGRIPPALTSSRARVGAPGCQTDTPIRRHVEQQNSRVRKAQPQTACLLPASLPPLPQPQALSSDLTSLEAEGEENSLFGRSGGGAGQSNALQLQPGLRAAPVGPTPAHICPAPGSWRCSRPGGVWRFLSPFNASLAPAPGSSTLPPSLAALQSQKDLAFRDHWSQTAICPGEAF